MTIEERAQALAWAIQRSETDDASGRILYALQQERSLAQMEIDVLEARCERLADVRVYEESATIEAKSLPTVRSKRDDMEQLGWTGL